MEYLADAIIVYLHELTSPEGDVWRWANTAEADGSYVRWRNVEWPPLDLKMEGFHWGGDVIPRPRVTAVLGQPQQEIQRVFLDLLSSTDGGRGLKLTTWRVPARCLEGHQDADLPFNPRPDIYIIDRASWSTDGVTWEFIAPLDLPRCSLPARYALHDTCPFVYRRWNKDRGAFDYHEGTSACPYTGKACFDRNGKPCKEAEDLCGGRLADCVKRFKNAPLPFGGFPGLGGRV